MPTPALKLSLGNGQSYENVQIYTQDEFGPAGISPLLGDYTFCFYCHGKYVLAHSYNVNVIQFGRAAAHTPGSVPYQRLVLKDDETYGPGHLIPVYEYHLVGIPEIFARVDWFSGFVFTAPEGLMMTTDASVATLECRAAVPAQAGPRPNP